MALSRHRPGTGTTAALAQRALPLGIGLGPNRELRVLLSRVWKQPSALEERCLPAPQ